MNEKSTPATGGCLCGAVRFEVSGPPNNTAYCYCKMCQQWSGSVLTSWAGFKTSDFRCTAGEIKYYKSSEFAERGFCPECGSSLVQRGSKDDWFSVSTGSFDHSEYFPPRVHSGIESQVSWLKVDDGLPRQTTNEHMGYTVED
ncbi:MAG: GFA family protein [Proteobacteria bacterium]|nr:GFA family protein [Pseudomonadota bacterium]